MPSETLVVAVAQTSPQPGDVRANARFAVDLVTSTADTGASLLVFPELSLVGYDLALLADPMAWVTVDDTRLDTIRQASEELGVTAVVGAAYRRDNGETLLASIALCPDGQMVVQGKRYLHGFERKLFQPGGPSQLLDVDGWRVALAVCYDAAVPSHAQDAVDRGADVYAVSALYTEEQERRFDVHLAARAIDHRMYAIAANLAGVGPGWRSCGGSGVWHPDGRRLTYAGTDPSIVTAALSHSELRELRDSDAQAGYPRAAAV